MGKKQRKPRVWLTSAELAAVLAGLRLLQGYNSNRVEATRDDVSDIVTDGGTLEPLSNRKIDRLCERLNHGERVR